MISVRKLIVVFAAVLGTLGYAAPVSAQATRTWVSGVGDERSGEAGTRARRAAATRYWQGALESAVSPGEANRDDGWQ